MMYTQEWKIKELSHNETNFWQIALKCLLKMLNIILCPKSEKISYLSDELFFLNESNNYKQILNKRHLNHCIV